MCELCRQYPCDFRCPNYKAPKAQHYCSICKEGIYEDDRYVDNEYGEYAHIDCLSQSSIYELIEWFGYEIRTMKDDYS